METEVWNIDVKKALEDPESFIPAAVQMLHSQHSELHHWNKYHNPTPSGFMGGQFYLGVDCVSCRFGEAERAVRKMIEVKILRDLALEVMNDSLAEIITAKADRLEAEANRG